MEDTACGTLAETGETPHICTLHDVASLYEGPSLEHAR